MTFENETRVRNALSLLSVLFHCRLFNLVLLEQDPLSDNWIKLDQVELVLGIGNILARGIEKSSASRTEELDGDGLALAASQ